MKYLLLLTTLVSNFTLASIEPADITTAKVSDPFYNYQWGMDFQGQKVYNELSDLENLLIVGNKNADIAIPFINTIDDQFKRDVIVAVIDTGVDYNHSDLKSNIFVNTIECENGEIPFEPEESKDSNIYPGDCKGWDFTGKKELGSNRPDDFVGHGTHIAGIIAAVKNNEIGISGVSNRIKILPIKVLSNNNEDSQALGTSDRLEKAILYAVEMKADIINLSLGWPLSFDKGHLKAAVKKAIDAGVIVVSASGNNDHSEPIMPCAYPGVLCVGSSDPDGKMSDFSNYGAHVDVLAPGNNIISTFPTANTPLFFDVVGYEVKSGTSQSTPYVSALAATIKGLDPSLTAEEIKAKIINGTGNSFDINNKFSNGSIINFKQALAASSSIARPSFKGFNRVKVDAKSKYFRFEIDFQMNKIDKEKLDISLLANENIVFDDYLFTIENKKITVAGHIKSLDVDLIQDMYLVVRNSGKVDTFKFQKRFYIDFNDLSNAKRFQIIGANPKDLSSISTVNYHHAPYDFPYYYLLNENKAGKVFALFTKVGDSIRNIGNVMLEKGVSEILSVHRIDANGDGVADIVLRSLILKENDEGEESSEIMYSYLTERLRPLFSKTVEVDGKKQRVDYSHFKLKFENVILQDLNDFAWVKMTYGDFGEISVPAYLTYGNIPEADSGPNPFARLRKRVFSSNIYYYEPVIVEAKPTFITRTFMTNRFIDDFKMKVGFRPFEQVFMVKFNKQSFEDIDKGEFSILISHESERKLPRNYTLSINSISSNEWLIKKLDGINLNLSEFITERSMDLTGDDVYAQTTERTLVGFEKSSRLAWEEFSLADRNKIEYVSIEQDDISNTLEYPIKTFMTDEGTFRFYLTPSKIYLEHSDGVKEKYSYPVHVSSFLPGMLFREQHYPISFSQGGKKIPALYVDSTQIASRNIYLITFKDDKIYAPISFNVNIPENCKALNPVIIDGYKYEYSIQCFTDKGTSELVYIPLEVE